MKFSPNDRPVSLFTLSVSLPSSLFLSVPSSLSLLINYVSHLIHILLSYLLPVSHQLESSSRSRGSQSDATITDCMRFNSHIPPPLYVSPSLSLSISLCLSSSEKLVSQFAPYSLVCDNIHLRFLTRVEA